MAAQIEILREEEGAGGWVFHAQVLDGAGDLHRMSLRLSWADYNLWSASGGDAPAAVAEAVLLFLIDRLPPDRSADTVDASIARRLSGNADERIPAMIRK